ncbi:GNAT family N-acetyltransferase [Sutcliffiella deserti]|uniref:GNAT family N-acetyltransferase n=1 Tax=Sutcliffiella deserti TaxID=2875501 RepID=UPI001CC07A18|nr:GNAT family N-acetyltransferase [Sutcliffiella deserti]
MNSILLDVSTELRTKRLFLRIPNAGDGVQVNAAIRSSIAELQPWLPFAQTIPEVEETESNLREAHVKFLQRSTFRFLMFHRETKEYIGTISLLNIDWNVLKGEIGYWLSTEYAGHGYMTEAVKKVVDWAIETLKFRRVEIRCESTNHRSRSIPENIGFKLEAILKNDDKSADGKRITDTCIYATIG